MILERKDQIVKKVREQWKEGLRPDGTIIGVYRNFAYSREKLAQNPKAGGNVDLILKGNLNKGLTVNQFAQSMFTIFSSDGKATDIAKKYGLDVYGLNDDEKVLFVESAINEALDIMIEIMYN